MQSTNLVIDWRTFSFDVIIVSLSILGIWLLPLSQLTRINLYFMGGIIITIALLTLHTKDVIRAEKNYIAYAILIGISIVFTLVGLATDQEFRLYLSGQEHLGSYANFRINNVDKNTNRFSVWMLLLGLGCIYTAVASILRDVYLRILHRYLDRKPA